MIQNKEDHQEDEKEEKEDDEEEEERGRWNYGDNINGKPYKKRKKITVLNKG